MVFISGTVTLSSLRFFSNIVAIFVIKRPLRSAQSGLGFMADRYVKRHLELAFSVDSVRPPELVIRPLRMLKE
jgi:hypothetical protein